MNLIEINAYRLLGNFLGEYLRAEYIITESAKKNKEVKVKVGNISKEKIMAPVKFRSIRFTGNLAILKEKTASKLVLKVDKEKLEEIINYIEEFEDDIDLVFDIKNEKLVRIRIYKHIEKQEEENKDKEV
ncbi:MAG: hypothetical protein ABDH37_09020, partial [Candidatus Hydrothermales bacterium]